MSLKVTGQFSGQSEAKRGAHPEGPYTAQKRNGVEVVRSEIIVAAPARLVMRVTEENVVRTTCGCIAWCEKSPATCVYGERVSRYNERVPATLADVH